MKKDPQIKWIGTFVGEVQKEGEIPREVLMTSLTIDQLQTGIFKDKKTGEFYLDPTYAHKKEVGLPTLDITDIPTSPVQNVIDVTMHYGTDVFWLAQEYRTPYSLLSIERACANDLYVGYISTPCNTLNSYGHGYLYDLGIAIDKEGYIGGFCQYEPTSKPVLYKDLVSLTQLFPVLQGQIITIEQAQKLLQEDLLYQRYIQLKEGQKRYHL